MGRHYTGPQFEDEVRNVARKLFSNSLGQGSKSVDGRERDGVFWNGEFYTVVEATTDRTKQKAIDGGKKTHDGPRRRSRKAARGRGSVPRAERHARTAGGGGLVSKLRREGDMARGFVITIHEPTVDQKDVIQKYAKTTKIISFDELRSLLFDAQSYIANRSNRRLEAYMIMLIIGMRSRLKTS